MDDKLNRATEVVAMLENILDENSKSKTFLHKTITHLCNEHHSHKVLMEVIERRLTLARREVELLEELKNLM